MRENQKGFTLVELIIAVAILAVVTLAVCGFIVVGSRSYTSANTDIMLQQEAQLALNQISDVIIDTTDSINYSGKTATASEMQSVLKDSEFNGEPTEKCLAVVNTNDTTSNNKNPSYWFYWSKDDETIYFNEVNVNSSMSQNEIEAGFNNAATDKAILAQHVKELHIDISQFEENRVVMISMTFQNGSREYTTSNNVTVRNRVAINKIDIEPMKKAQEFTITTVKNVILEPGDTYSLPFTVESNATDPGAKDVRWEMVEGSQNGSSISAEGRLTIGREETRESFFVKVVRVNEEYANQNDKVAKTVKVRIKRVNTVNLSCSETTIKAGSTVTVSGSAVGYLLGSNCNGEGCITDDVTKDHDLVSTISAAGWTIVRGPATIESADSKEAKIKILSTAKKGDEIEIEARALLPEPDRKNYGPVTGRLVLKVTEGTNGAKFIGSELKFGTDNDPGIFDYMRPSLKTDHGRYIFCIRVREAGTVGYQNDYVMVYYTQGANERFSPDAFGLDHTKSYEVYFQVLDARPKGSTQEATKEMVKAEYTNPNNLDDNGKYIGSMFEADEYYYGVLNPPSVAVTINGVTYPNDEKESYEHFSFWTNPNGDPLPGMIDIAAAGAVNIWREAVLNNTRFTVYKEDENGRWKRVYGYAYDYDMEEYVGYRSGTTRSLVRDISPNHEGKFNDSDKQNYKGQSTFGKIVLQPGQNPTVKNLTNPNAQEIQEACGMYHIVPGYIYANNPDIREGAYSGDNVIIKEVPGDYATYYYKEWDCVINLKIDMEFNLHLRTVGEEKRMTYFPVPSDWAFPFDRKSEAKQVIFYNFKEYSENKVHRGDLNDVKVTCEYQGGNVYLITLSSVEKSGNQIITHTYGKYVNETNEEGQEIWRRIDIGGTTKEDAKTNLTFIRDYKEYGAYFPTPYDADFPVNVFNNSSIINNWQMLSFSTSDDNLRLDNCIVKCSSDPYEMTITVEYPGYYNHDASTINPHKKRVYDYGTFRFDGKETWEQVPGSGSNTGEYVGVWGSLIHFSRNGDFKMEMPLPGEQGFPSFTDSYSDSTAMQCFYEWDEFGDHIWCDTNGITRIYSYKDGVYTLTLRNDWGGNELGTWTCPSGGSKWTQK